MTGPTTTDRTCNACRAPLAADDRVCPNCGAAVDGPPGSPAPLRRSAPPEMTRGQLLLVVFLALGALALPAIWKSRHFSPTGKWVLSVLAVLYTTSMLVACAFVMLWFWDVLREYQGAIR